MHETSNLLHNSHNSHGNHDEYVLKTLSPFFGNKQVKSILEKRHSPHQFKNYCSPPPVQSMNCQNPEPPPIDNQAILLPYLLYTKAIVQLKQQRSQMVQEQCYNEWWRCGIRSPCYFAMGYGVVQLALINPPAAAAVVGCLASTECGTLPSEIPAWACALCVGATNDAAFTHHSSAAIPHHATVSHHEAPSHHATVSHHEAPSHHEDPSHQNFSPIIYPITFPHQDAAAKPHAHHHSDLEIAGEVVEGTHKVAESLEECACCHQVFQIIATTVDAVADRIMAYLTCHDYPGAVANRPLYSKGTRCLADRRCGIPPLTSEPCIPALYEFFPDVCECRGPSFAKRFMDYKIETLELKRKAILKKVPVAFFQAGDALTYTQLERLCDDTGFKERRQVPHMYAPANRF